MSDKLLHSSIVSKEAIDFTAPAVMPDNSINEQFNLRTWLGGKKGLINFYPLDFTFVCPSELIAFNNRMGLFTEKNTKVIGVERDSLDFSIFDIFF